MVVAVMATAASGATAQAATRWVKENASGPPPGTNCGKAGHPTIQSAVTAAAPGDLIIVCGGRYAENVVVDRSVTIQGQGDPTVVPAGEDANVDSSAATPLQIAFRVDADDVTIRDLTVDGQGNKALTKDKNNFRFAVRLPFAGPSNHSGLTVKNLKIRNIYRRAIQIEGGAGHLVTGNDIDKIEVGFGIIAFEAQGLITSNKIRHSPEGIGSNYLTTFVNAPVLDIANNDVNAIDIGLDISGLGVGSKVHDNKVDVKGGSDFGLGVVLQYATGHVELTGNRIEGSKADAGMWLYHNEEDSDLVVQGNVLDTAGPEDMGVGSATGIFMTDDGSLFGDEDGSSYATVRMNDIRHWLRGVHVYRNGAVPPPGRPVQPGPPFSVTSGDFLQNCIRENREWGMLVSGANAAVYGNVQAQNTWWGAKDGPSGAGPGHGDAVSALVDFVPFATDSKVCKS
jgi:nitrous oxidase accessory protein NosD